MKSHDQIIDAPAIQYLATVFGTFAVILLYAYLVYKHRPSQIETEDEQLDAFKSRTKRIRKRKWFVDRLMDDGMGDHVQSAMDRGES